VNIFDIEDVGMPVDVDIKFDFSEIELDIHS